MDKEAMFETTAIIDIDEEIKKEEEILNTIKMEPILEKTEIVEEETVEIKKRKIRITDLFLIALIFILSIVFILVVIKVK